MTTILKTEQIRNTRNDATIVVEKYAEKGAGVMWRYYIKYDGHALVSGYSDGLWNKPKTKWLKNRF